MKRTTLEAIQSLYSNERKKLACHQIWDRVLLSVSVGGSPFIFVQFKPKSALQALGRSRLVRAMRLDW